MNKLKSAFLLAGALLILASAILLFLPRFLKCNKNKTEPCPFNYTVDLTGYEKLPNESYLYKGIIIPPELWAVYEYKIDDFSKIICTEPHVRGCACLLKPCVKFCCSIDKYNYYDECGDLDDDEYSTEMIIKTRSGETRNVDLNEYFVIQNGSGCLHKYFLNPQNYSYDAFELLEDGVLRIEEKSNFSKDEYCLSQNRVENQTTFVPTPMRCGSNEIVDGTSSIVTVITMLFSVPFFVLTIIVYLVLPQLRTLHGLSLCCYLLAQSFAYSLMANIVLTPIHYHTDFICKAIGYSTYFSFIASFCWISVISFDLCYNIPSPRVRYNPLNRFIMYSIFAWGLSFIFLSVVIVADHSEIIPENWRPGITNDHRCWFDAIHGWTQLIYMFTPLAIFVVFCTIMFIKTALKIHGIQNEMDNVMEHKDSQKNISNERDRFGIFIRLFFLMGILWILEIISYILGNKSFVTYILNNFIAIQGPVIFSLFVYTKTVRKYIKKRFFPISNSEIQSQESYKSQISSGITLNENEYQKRNDMK